MKSVWNPADARDLHDRIDRLSGTTAARWGRMSAPQMIMHLCDALRMASGELPVRSRNLPIRYPPLKQLIVYFVPIPKNFPTAPELIARAPSEWTADVGELHLRLEEFVRRGPTATAAEHPAFGKMTGRQWGVLVYRHMDHHLRQFGV